MEISQALVGSRLYAIERKPNHVRLIFKNTAKRRSYYLHGKGFVFETTGFTLNQPVKVVSLNDSLGFKARAKLEQLAINPAQYRQLFVEMQGPTEDKNELIGALSDVRFSQRAISSVVKKNVAPKKKNTKSK